ncbi:hypothetical protein F4678DRAFT_60929 [Xylaria arbuscula]|nr:hypothetical protein F4678DRAFT_60929 [Xylaria arbuscula]
MAIDAKMSESRFSANKILVYPNAVGYSLLILYDVLLMEEPGHCWASTEINFSQISVLEGPMHIQASQIIMDFFDQHTKP